MVCILFLLIYHIMQRYDDLYLTGDPVRYINTPPKGGGYILIPYHLA